MVVAALLVVFAPGLLAQGGDPKPKLTEYEIKAQFLTHLAILTSWTPETLPHGKDKDLVIGIVGQHGFSADDLKLIQSKRNEASGRRIVVRQLSSAADASPCQIVFVAKSASEELLREVVKTTANKPIMTILDREGNGAVVEMFVRGTVKLRVDEKDARARGLRISSRILKIAEKRE